MKCMLLSSLDDIKSALLTQNPFNDICVDYHKIWGENFLDVKSFNAQASNAVLNALKTHQKTSIVITAEYGTGKSHIISRIRHNLKEQKDGLFVYANKYSNLQNLHLEFQKTLAKSLDEIGKQGVTQWQELATVMANSTFSKKVNSKQVVNYFNQHKTKPEQIFNYIKKISERFQENQYIQDTDIVRAIFWTLSNQHRSDAVKWLSGQEIAQFKAEELGLPSQNQSFDAVLQILDLINKYYPLIICFDELDQPGIDPDTGLTRAQIVAGLIKELFENIKRGVILTVMLPAVWKDKIKIMPISLDKISSFGEPIDLKLIDENSVIELVKLRLNKFYEFNQLFPPHPLYPFSEDELRKLGKSKSSTVRDILKKCRDDLPKILDNLGVQPVDLVAEAFDLEIKQPIDLDDNILLAKALYFSFQQLIGETVEGVKITKLTQQVKDNGSKDNYINFKIIGEEKNKEITIGVAVLQQEGGKALGAGLRKLNDYETYGLTRGCLIRSQDKKVSKHLQKTYLKPLLQEKGGEFVELKIDEIKPLIAIWHIRDKEIDYPNLTEEQIFKFIQDNKIEKKLGSNNPLLREILSDPSGLIPDDMIIDKQV